jgi:hypothetical protein
VGFLFGCLGWWSSLWGFSFAGVFGGFSLFYSFLFCGPFVYTQCTLWVPYAFNNISVFLSKRKKVLLPFSFSFPLFFLSFFLFFSFLFVFF